MDAFSGEAGHSGRALASVIVDRIVGLYVLFLVAAGGSSSRVLELPDPKRPSDLLGVLIVTFVSTVGICWSCFPVSWKGR